MTNDMKDFALGRPSNIASAIIASQNDAAREREFHARQDAARREAEFPGTAARVAARCAERLANRK